MKKLNNTIVPLLITFAFAYVFSACSSSHIISVWKEPDVKSSSLKKYFVISVNNNSTKRRQWEDAIVDALNSCGVSAAPSYKYFPKDVPDSAGLKSFLGNKFDAVMMIHKVSEENRKYRTPGYAAIYPVGGYRNYFYRSYAHIYHEVYFPGRIEREKIYQLETNIYEPGEDGRLIWSAVTETRNPRSTGDFTTELLEILIPKLTLDRILPVQK
jgi:hypothetical protein